MISEHLNAIKSAEEELAATMEKYLVCFTLCLLPTAGICIDFPNVLEQELRFPWDFHITE